MKNFIALMIGLVLAMAVGIANAAITATDLTAIGTEVTADATTVFTWALPILGTVLAMTVGIKLFKRFTNKI